MRVVVTGALGHIGSRLIRELPAALPGAEIVMIDNLATERYASLFDLPAHGRYQFVEADVLTADLARLFAGADAVVHLAALTNWARTDLHQQMERVNVAGTERVARASSRPARRCCFRRQPVFTASPAWWPKRVTRRTCDLRVSTPSGSCTRSGRCAR